MANDSYTQQALAADSNFHTRVEAALGKVAWQVLEEPTNTPGHEIRANYARRVLSDLPGNVNQIAPWLVMRTNVFGFATTYNFPAGAVVTASGDPDIESQLMTDWNHLSGVA